jgi:hypothetical protein
MEKSEQEKFLSDLDVDKKDVLDAPLEGTEVKTEETPEDSELKLKNRRERRLAEKWQAEREANIALNARLETITESQKLREGTEEAEYLKRVEKIYGNATPEAKEATELLKEALQGVRASALKDALEEFQKERGNETQAVRDEEQNLDAIMERVEDDYGIDMASDDRKGFLTLLERLSPKDQDGNIIEYADPDSTAELYLSRKEKSSSRAKELASRSMTRSGTSQPSKLQEDATWKALKDAGIF